MPSLNPDTFQPGGSMRSATRTISPAQRAYLIAMCIEEGISEGPDDRLVEAWIFESFGYDVGDVGSLTREQYYEILESRGWE